MNSLSWFIYLIQVTDSLRDVAIFSLILLTMVMVPWGVVAGFLAAHDDDPEQFALYKSIAKKYIIPMAVVAGIIAIFVPNRQTLLLIAGSEIGERVIKSEDVRGVIDPSMDLLKAWIKAETEHLTKKDAK